MYFPDFPSEFNFKILSITSTVNSRLKRVSSFTCESEMPERKTKLFRTIFPESQNKKEPRFKTKHEKVLDKTASLSSIGTRSKKKNRYYRGACSVEF